MEQAVKRIGKEYKWYQAWAFPLLPRIETRPARKPEHQHDDGQPWGFSFRWLMFTAWSLEHADFEVAVVCGTHWGVGVIGILPYLRWSVCIPCPPRLGDWLNRALRRRI